MLPLYLPPLVNWLRESAWSTCFFMLISFLHCGNIYSRIIRIWLSEYRRGDSCSNLALQHLCSGFSPRLNTSPHLPNFLVDSSSDSLSLGVPPKSPDHSDVNISSISTQTHQEARSPKTSGDVWHCTHPPETSAGALAPPQRFDTGADIPHPTSRS